MSNSARRFVFYTKTAVTGGLPIMVYSNDVNNDDVNNDDETNNETNGGKICKGEVRTLKEGVKDNVCAAGTLVRRRTLVRRTKHEWKEDKTRV